MVLRSDGRVTVHVTVPKRLLGTGTPRARLNHEVRLQPGETMLLYPDSIVEHRGGWTREAHGSPPPYAIRRRASTLPIQMRALHARTTSISAGIACRAQTARSEVEQGPAAP
jgi:hypothetical protein